MTFINVLLRTLGFLVAITIFIFLLNIVLFFLPERKDYFAYVEGDNQSKNIIAVLSLNGPIINKLDNSIANELFEYINPNKVKKYLIKLKDIKPKVVIFRVNSPGGTVTASSYFEKLITNFKKENDADVYFYSDEILASGAYWVATTGEKIYANYGSIIGSIGVSGPSWYFYNKPKSISNNLFGQKIETLDGIEIYDQNAGYSKDLYNPFRKPSKRELNHLENIINEIYDDFVIKVSNSRKIEINFVKNDIGALIYSSNQAKSNYLIDEILDFDDLIKKIILDNKYKDYKIIKTRENNSFASKYLAGYLGNNNSKICNKLNSSFTSIFPFYLNNC